MREIKLLVFCILLILSFVVNGGGGVNQTINNGGGTIGGDAKNIIEGDADTGDENNQNDINLSIDADYFKEVFGNQEAAKPNSDQVDSLLAYAKGAKNSNLIKKLIRCKGNITSCLVSPK